MNTKYTILILFAMMIAACTNENDAGGDFASVPLQITAQIGQDGATRVADKTYFSNGDVIGIKTATANAPYTYSGSAWSGSYYFEHNTVDIWAYYPYKDGAYIGETLEIDDYLFAAKRSIAATDDPVSFEFDHVMSKLSFTFTKGADVTEDDLKGINSVTISGLIAQGTFNTSTGVASSSSDGSVADIATESNYSAIVFPQEGSFTVSFVMNGVTYTTNSISANFASGLKYDYTITVSKTAMEISSASINPWTTEVTGLGTEDESATDIYTYGSIPYVGYSGETISKYALAFSDGSFENLTSPYADAIEKLYKFNLKEVVGVVFYLGDQAATDDPALAKDYPECNHGLICAVYNAKTIKEYQYDSKMVRMHWQTIGKTASIADWFTSCTMDKDLYSYTDITESSKITKILGYNNTQVLKAYNAALTDNDYLVRPIHAISNYTVFSPAGASSWFMPSAYELNLLQDKNMITIMNTLSSILEKDTSDEKYRYIPFCPSGGSTYTWSSTEKNSGVVWSVDFKTDSKGEISNSGLTESDKNTSNDKDKDGNDLQNAFNVRPICAF